MAGFGVNNIKEASSATNFAFLILHFSILNRRAVGELEDPSLDG